MKPLHRLLLLATPLAALAACAQMPQAVKDLGWQDLWGDRGQGVLARDYDKCQELVEQRRSLIEGCMAARGWKTRAD